MTRLLQSDPAGIAEAARLLRRGGLVAFGTETVYGLGGDATNGHAVAAIFAAKGRPHFNPLICHFPDAEAAFAHVEASGVAHALAQAFWPGPLTMVLPKRMTSPINLLAGAGLDTLAVRVPAPEAARALLRAACVPIAAPSANRSGAISPTTSAHVLDELSGRIDAVLECGPAAVGLESTVLDLTGAHPVLLRPGGVAVELIEAVRGPVGRSINPEQAEASRYPRSPGMLASHYAPVLPLRLQATQAGADEALLAFGPPLPGAGMVWQLSERRDLAEAAARLFAGLRWLDDRGRAQGFAGIAAMTVPDGGLGVAINDRLQRASVPRRTHS